MHTFPVIAGQLHFNPRPPRGERRSAARRTKRNLNISIHALREESDARENGDFEGWNYFNPRPPRGERPAHDGSRVELDQFQSTPSARRATFGSLTTCKQQCIFQSTPSARRATERSTIYSGDIMISIHALREESDDPKKHRTRQAV